MTSTPADAPDRGRLRLRRAASIFRAALALDTAGVLGFCAVALAHPRSGTAVARAFVGVAGVALAYPALHLVSSADTRAMPGGRTARAAAALVATGLLINTVGGVPLVRRAEKPTRRTSGSSALSWLLLAGGNVLSMVYLAAIRVTPAAAGYRENSND